MSPEQKFYCHAKCLRASLICFHYFFKARIAFELTEKRSRGNATTMEFTKFVFVTCDAEEWIRESRE